MTHKHQGKKAVILKAYYTALLWMLCSVSEAPGVQTPSTQITNKVRLHENTFDT